MAWWFSKKGLRPAVIQTDTFRPGAFDQAEEMADRAEVAFYGDPDCDDPVQIARDGLEATEDADVHIVDTAGRHALEDDLIAEIEEIDRVVDPDRSLLVLDAAIGQGAKDQATEFERAIGIDGVMITKLDGTAKGGGALTAVNETDSSIAFLGSGETVQDIERFEASGFISRLLGMGDLQQLAERVERAMDGPHGAVGSGDGHDPRTGWRADGPTARRRDGCHPRPDAGLRDRDGFDDRPGDD
jgi:signal recognition particle subunit SRP54